MTNRLLMIACLTGYSASNAQAELVMYANGISGSFNFAGPAQTSPNAPGLGVIYLRIAERTRGVPTAVAAVSINVELKPLPVVFASGTAADQGGFIFSGDTVEGDGASSRSRTAPTGTFFSIPGNSTNVRSDPYGKPLDFSAGSVSSFYMLSYIQTAFTTEDVDGLLIGAIVAKPGTSGYAAGIIAPTLGIEYAVQYGFYFDVTPEPATPLMTLAIAAIACVRRRTSATSIPSITADVPDRLA